MAKKKKEEKEKPVKNFKCDAYLKISKDGSIWIRSPKGVQLEIHFNAEGFDKMTKDQENTMGQIKRLILKADIREKEYQASNHIPPVRNPEAGAWAKYDEGVKKESWYAPGYLTYSIWLSIEQLKIFKEVHDLVDY